MLDVERWAFSEILCDLCPLAERSGPYFFFLPSPILPRVFKTWCRQVGFTRFEVIHLAGPSNAAIAYKKT
jgi:hypothetical protein